MDLKSNKYHFDKIADTLAFIDKNFKEQPSLDIIAEHINMSPFHFQRLFKDWVGISPKKYLKFISLEYAKNLIKQNNLSLFDTAYETGLSSTSRLHDLFISIEGMTPGEYKNNGANLSIKYSLSETPFGNIFIASTNKGVCNLSFVDEIDTGLEALKKRFPNASYLHQLDPLQLDALQIFQSNWSRIREIKLHLKGTDFQLKVWEALLTIPYGALLTYGGIAEAINLPKASRAVGTAIGNNPIAYLIPCHRVIQKSGQIGGYHWDPIRKKAIIGWEASKIVSDIE
ncbi:methylated-DNA--[protein]-cysteine S-methyltransferase [Halosquirtibacter xylanolyticus]|uniref:bifunctional transcriptional activator/DNA repair enzyme AdaA n=1 Tax=Halosquirtibacter xylanolyticus TaxID=3374599 RepID=UPI003749DD23|nr:methylated-DNA--[protein]-cysteine S-methyltransferase [Prolixibacteraceae bacterium]